MHKRNPFLVFILAWITAGIYGIVWFIETKTEMERKGAQIPTAWMILIPIVQIYWLWKYSEGVELVTNKSMSAGFAFFLLVVLNIIGMAIIQSKYNSLPASTQGGQA